MELMQKENTFLSDQKTNKDFVNIRKENDNIYEWMKTEYDKEIMDFLFLKNIEKEVHNIFQKEHKIYTKEK